MSLSEEIQALVQKEHYDFHDLAVLTRILRSEQGCPWDREQDHHSIRTGLIEETYEVVEAIDNEDPVLLREELGDLLFQVFFHAQIEAEKEGFDICGVVDDITKKMIHRHPHVFGAVGVASSREVLQNWENIKTEEKQRNTLEAKLRAIPPMMPALMRASKVGKKAGIEPATNADVILDRLEAELAKMRTSDADREAAIGSLLMHVTDLSRAYEVDAEYALSRATNRLIDDACQKNEKKGENI